MGVINVKFNFPPTPSLSSSPRAPLASQGESGFLRLTAIEAFQVVAARGEWPPEKLAPGNDDLRVSAFIGMPGRGEGGVVLVIKGCG